ncbi:hypothetical protein WJX74_008171 [Apatococcus lobatus]|uniref:Ubiquitin carboxyl-terminal hydrolase 7 ICP0-binding domain-containing protein n=1 Tax=Apatococcus lobatus TaxID=904363 RepID=A0AAW1RTV5_9CHLO
MDLQQGAERGSEVLQLRREAAQLRHQLAEVKRVDDQELEKLWRLAERQSDQLAQDQVKIAELERACAEKEELQVRAQAVATEASGRLPESHGAGPLQQDLAGHAQQPQHSLAGAVTSHVEQHVLDSFQESMQAALNQHLEQQLPRQMAAAMQRHSVQVVAAVRQAMPQSQASEAADAMHGNLTAISQQLMNVASQAQQVQSAQVQQLPVLDRLDAQLPAGISGIKEAVSGCESRMALSLIKLHEELKGQDDTISSLLNKAVKLMSKQTDKDTQYLSAVVQDGLKDLANATNSEQKEARKGLRDVSQRMGTALDDIKGLEASIKQLATSMAKQASQTASVEKSCTYQEGKLKSIKQLQESHASGMDRLQQLLEPLQEKLDALNAQTGQVLIGIQHISKPQQAQPPAMPDAEMIQIAQSAAQLADLRPALLKVAEGLTQGADIGHEQRPEQQQQQQHVVGEDQMQDQDQAMIMSEVASGAHPAASLTDLQDLSRAATVIMHSLDAVLEHLEALKGQSATRSDIQRLEGLIAAMQHTPAASGRAHAAAESAGAAAHSEPPDALMTALPAATPPATRALNHSSQRGVEQDAKRWLLVNVVTHQDLVTHTATEHFDLMNPDKCKQLRVKKTVKIKGFKLQINAELQIPVRSQRLWLWTWRENKSYRLARPLTADEANKKLMGDLVPGGEVADSQRPLLGHGSDHLDLFLETPVFLGSGLPPRAKGNIMLFCKFFDHQQQKLRYVGHIDANKNMTIGLLASTCSLMAGLEPSLRLEMYEEISFEPKVMCKLLHSQHTLPECGCQDGDIIIFQAAVPKEAESNFQFPHVPSFLKHLKECIMVNFVRLDEASRSNVQPLQLELLPSSSYKQICNALAKALQLDDWRRLRFTQQMFHGRPQPRDQPLKFNGLARLSLMLKYFNHTCTTLYYEILGQPLNDIENQDRQVQSALPHLQPADPGSMPLAQQPDGTQQNQAGPQVAPETITTSAQQSSEPANSLALQPSEDPAVPQCALRPGRAPIHWQAPPQSPAAQPSATALNMSSQLQVAGDSSMPPGFDTPNRSLPASVTAAHDAVFNCTGPPAPEGPGRPALFALAPNPAHLSCYAVSSRPALPTVSGPASLQPVAARNFAKQRTATNSPLAATLSGLAPSVTSAGQQQALPIADHPPRSPSRRVDRNVQDTTAKKPSSRSDTGGAVPSQPQPERSKPLKTTPKQLPLKRAAAETSQGQRSTSPRKRRKEPTVECVCCKQAGQSAQFPSELELNQHQLSDEHLQAIRDMLREHYGVRTIDASERSTALKPSKKPHARVTLPSMCICRPCNKPSYMGFFDFMLHSLKRNHLDNVQEKVASALRDMALSARKTPEQAPTTLTALPGPEPVPAQDSRLPGPPLRTSSGTMMREQGVPQETRWERTGLAMLPGDTGMDIEEGELTRPATAASPRTSEGGSREHHPRRYIH